MSCISFFVFMYFVPFIRMEVIVPDEEGKIGAVESKPQSVDGAGQIDTEEVTLA